jgi:hypothetical protein
VIYRSGDGVGVVRLLEEAPRLDFIHELKCHKSRLFVRCNSRRKLEIGFGERSRFWSKFNLECSWAARGMRDCRHHESREERLLSPRSIMHNECMKTTAAKATSRRAAHYGAERKKKINNLASVNYLARNGSENKHDFRVNERQCCLF